LGDNGVKGIQNGGMTVMDLGELPKLAVYRLYVEWLMGIVCYDGDSVRKLIR